MIINPISYGGSGLLPEIIVTAAAGSTLDLIQNGVVLKTYTLGSTETQHTFVVRNVGKYTVKSTLDDKTTSVSVTVDAIAQYNVSANFYNYGDGSKNIVPLGYEGILRCNGKTVMHATASNYNNSTNFRLNSETAHETTDGQINLDVAARRAIGILCGESQTDISKYTDDQYKFLDGKGILLHNFQAGVSGTNTVNFSQPVTGEYTIFTQIDYWNFTSGIYLSTLKYIVDGSYKTLREMVEQGICKPLVLLSSNATYGDYYFPNALDLYAGGQTSSGNYPQFRVMFMLNKGYTLLCMQYYANKSRGSSSYADGLSGVAAFDTDDLRLTIE